MYAFKSKHGKTLYAIITASNDLVSTFFTHVPVISLSALRSLPPPPAWVCILGLKISNLCFQALLQQQPWRIRCPYLPSREDQPQEFRKLRASSHSAFRACSVLEPFLKLYDLLRSLLPSGPICLPFIGLTLAVGLKAFPSTLLPSPLHHQELLAPINLWHIEFHRDVYFPEDLSLHICHLLLIPFSQWGRLESS